LCIRAAWIFGKTAFFPKMIQNEIGQLHFENAVTSPFARQTAE
jgi:hypothetical protein